MGKIDRPRVGHLMSVYALERWHDRCLMIRQQNYSMNKPHDVTLAHRTLGSLRLLRRLFLPASSAPQPLRLPDFSDASGRRCKRVKTPPHFPGPGDYLRGGGQRRYQSDSQCPSQDNLAMHKLKSIPLPMRRVFLYITTMFSRLFRTNTNFHILHTLY